MSGQPDNAWRWLFLVGLVLGYEDLVDHDELRSDPLLAAVLTGTFTIEQILENGTRRPEAEKIQAIRQWAQPRTVRELRSFLGMNINPVVATERDILRALDRYYSVGGESVETLIAGMEQDEELMAAVQRREAAAFEELAFRGVLFGLLMQEGESKALWLTSGIFGVYHLPFMRTVTHNIYFGKSHLLTPVIPAK